MIIYGLKENGQKIGPLNRRLNKTDSDSGFLQCFLSFFPNRRRGNQMLRTPTKTKPVTLTRAALIYSVFAHYGLANSLGLLKKNSQRECSCTSLKLNGVIYFY